MNRHGHPAAAAILLILLTLGAASVLALAPFPGSGQVQAKDVGARAGETEWKYTHIEGALHKRLWSVTYNRWLTDWIPC